jgi:hypothetical protein
VSRDLITGIGLVGIDEFVDKLSYPGPIIIAGDMLQGILLS